MTLLTDKSFDSDEILACSDCFLDHGLKLEAERCGQLMESRCPQCNSISGSKLTGGDLYGLSYSFFVNGSRIRTDYGGSVAIQFNEHHEGVGDIVFPGNLEQDAKLVAKLINIGFFLYGPRLWMVGEVEPLKSLQLPEERDEIIKRILNEFPIAKLPKDTLFYRLRVNPKQQMDPAEYDSAPEGYLGRGRLDSKDLPILYGSFDIEACLHECRVTLEQELYLSNMKIIKDMRVLDLTQRIEEQVTEFESLNMAIHMIFRAPAHSYEIIRAIALAAKRIGLDGIIYPSYYNQIHASEEIVKNLGLFGRPVQDGLVVSECVNRVRLKKVTYDYHFGPGDF